MHTIRFLPANLSIESRPRETLLDVACRAGLLIVAPCGGRGVCSKCYVTIDGKLELACQYIPERDLTVELAADSLLGDQSERAASDYVSLWLDKHTQPNRSLLAVDLGTTGVSSLWVHGKQTKSAKTKNQQLAYGSDVLSRIMAVEEGGKAIADELSRLAKQSITTAISNLGSIAPVDTIMLSANPTMIHLLLQWNPLGIRSIPAEPVELKPVSIPAREVLGAIPGLNIDVSISFLPGVAGYLGGDVLAGMALLRRLFPQDRRQLLIDAGTNGEIMLWNEGAVLGIATSAGPAFEGGEVTAGTPATLGAIDRIRIEKKTLWSDYSTIGGGAPCGICGSGIIELVAELDRADALSRNGHLRPDSTSDLITNGEHGLEYLIVPHHSTSDKRNLIINDFDLEAIINTKAAIYAGCRRLMGVMNISFNDLDRVAIAGDFGYHINLEDALRIGMLPDIPLERFVFLGNASLSGALISLLDKSFHSSIENLADNTTFIDLSTDMGFIEEYTAARFLPHTDLGQFPSVRK